MSETSIVLEERHDRVVLLTLNRPEKHNALNAELSGALDAALLRAQEDPDVRVIVLTGAGDKSFCAGADMLELSGIEKAQAVPVPGAMDPNRRILECPLPIIAAINGYCYGGGARLAISADIRLASTTATFRLPGAEYGLAVAAATLPRLVGSAKAKELIFTARKVEAQEALDLGLVNSLHAPAELLPAALDMAHTIARHSPGAVRESKRIINEATMSQLAIQMENDANRGLRGSEEQVSRFANATQRVTGRTVS